MRHFRYKTVMVLVMVCFCGYGDIVIDQRWRLMAAFEAANGIIIFGLTTAVVSPRCSVYI